MTLLHFCVVTILIVTSRTNSMGTLVDRGHPTNCTEVNDVFKTVSAYYGWPFSMKCDPLRAHWNEIFGAEFSSTGAECFVEDLRTSTFNTSDSLVLESHMPALSEFLLYQTSGTRCLTTRFNVSLLPFPATSCLGAIQEATRCDKNLQYLNYKMQDVMKLRCIAALGSDTIEPPSDTYKTHWLFTERERNGSVMSSKSCKPVAEVKNAHQIYTSDDPGHPNRFQKTAMSLYDPGIYTCAVTYQGMTAYIAHYSVCVYQPPHEKFELMLMCEKEITFFSGDDITVKCDARKNRDQLQPGDLQISWTKANHVLCKNEYDQSLTSSGVDDSRIKCGLQNFVNNQSYCYPYVPSEQEVQVDIVERTFEIYLKISNIAKSDAGEYYARVQYKNAMSEPVLVTLEFNRLRELRTIVVILVAVLVFVVVSALAAFFGWQYRSLIKLFYRRHFGKYDNDDREYVAILAYFFTSDMPKDVCDATRNIVTSIKKKMTELNYSYYDPMEKFDQGFCVETLLKYLDKSHRMIVVLTEEYVRDSWARFVAQQGVINMQRNQAKLIFVRTPHIGKILRSNSDQTTMVELRNAIRTCRNVKWKKDSDSRFLADIEYALPNLQRTSSYEKELCSYNALQDAPSLMEKTSPEDFAFHSSPSAAEENMV